MAVQLGGVETYAKGTAGITVGFPNGEVSCKHCWLCVDDARMRQRRVCLATMEILWDINRIGARCPLEIEESEGQNDGRT